MARSPLVQAHGAHLGGVELLERQVLQRRLEVPHAQAVGQRRPHVHRLARQPVALGSGQRAQRAHVVQPVRHLHQQRVVAAHGHQHAHLKQQQGRQEGGHVAAGVSTLGSRKTAGLHASQLRLPRCTKAGQLRAPPLPRHLAGQLIGCRHWRWHTCGRPGGRPHQLGGGGLLAVG